MKTFKQFLREAQVVSAFPISRADMPQLDDIEKFLDWVRTERGVDYLLHLLPPNMILPTQAEYDEDKVASMGVPDSPILISKEGFIVDGHHRYFATVLNDPTKLMMRAYHMDTSINQALALAKEYIETIQDGS